MNGVRWAWVTDNMTFVSPLGLGVTLLMGLLLILLPRKYAFIPLLALTCFMTMGQRVLIVGLNFTMIRILILLGWLRLILRREFRPIEFNGLDRVILIWSVVGVVAYSLLWLTSEAMIYRLGQAYNAVGTYFLFRYMIQDMDDIKRLLRTLAVFVIPLAALMIVEKSTGRNVFASLKGVPEMSEVRLGVIRCQGPFAHSILAGTFGASLLPLLLAMPRQGMSSRFLSWLALIAAVVIVVMGGSSGPIMACMFGLIGFCFWPLRDYMRAVRWAIVCLLVALQLAMKAPIWFLIARVSVFDGSTGYHRSFLIQQAVTNFDEWWLFGVQSTAHWGYEMVDITNQYIRQGIEGGVLTMGLYVAILVLAFRMVGRGMRSHQDRPTQFLIWSMGCALVVHMFSFISVSYFDQNFVNWYLLLAMIASVLEVREPALDPVPDGESQPDEQDPYISQALVY